MGFNKRQVKSASHPGGDFDVLARCYSVKLSIDGQNLQKKFQP